MIERREGWMEAAEYRSDNRTHGEDRYVRGGGGTSGCGYRKGMARERT